MQHDARKAIYHKITKSHFRTVRQNLLSTFRGNFRELHFSNFSFLRFQSDLIMQQTRYFCKSETWHEVCIRSRVPCVSHSSSRFSAKFFCYGRQPRNWEQIWRAQGIGCVKLKKDKRKKAGFVTRTDLSDIWVRSAQEFNYRAYPAG